MVARRTMLTGGVASAATLALGGGMAAASALSDAALAKLRSGLRGGLVLPGDARYDALRRVRSFNPETDKRPAVIVQCANAGDVARAIEAARSAGLDLAVRAGGNDVL